MERIEIGGAGRETKIICEICVNPNNLRSIFALMRPQDISINDYTYELPNDRIAQTPLPERDASKLLVYQHGNISQDVFRNVTNYLPADGLLVVNSTRVLQARILFQKPSGGVIEIFCLHPHAQYPDMETALQQPGKVLWHCYIGGASKWKAGQVLKKDVTGTHPMTVYARYVEKVNDTFLIEISWEKVNKEDQEDYLFIDVLTLAGVLPLPPYIKRAATWEDAKRYQTIFSRYYGSVAAPTAALHMTENVLNDIHAKNIRMSSIILHVGAGTFKPVKSETMAGHEMHAEYFEIDRELVMDLVDYVFNQKPITVIGTTSFRAVESIYWIGVKLFKQPDLPREQWAIEQWEPYELEKENVPVIEALKAVYHRTNKMSQEIIATSTRLLVTPAYKIKIADSLITNFHQPQSTLLLLVAAFAGEDWRKIYQYALENDFRFLSYGDSSLLFRS